MDRHSRQSFTVTAVVENIFSEFKANICGTPRAATKAGHGGAKRCCGDGLARAGWRAHVRRLEGAE